MVKNSVVWYGVLIIKLQWNDSITFIGNTNNWLSLLYAGPKDSAQFPVFSYQAWFVISQFHLIQKYISLH